MGGDGVFIAGTPAETVLAPAERNVALKERRKLPDRTTSRYPQTTGKEAKWELGRIRIKGQSYSPRDGARRTIVSKIKLERGDCSMSDGRNVFHS